MDRQGGPRALDGASVVLPERDRRAADGAARRKGSCPACARAPAAGAPRPALPRMVSAHVAPESDLRRDRRRFPLVARCRGALVRAAAEAAPRTACDDGAARRSAEAPPPPPRARARLHGEPVHDRVAGVPEAQPPRPEPRPDHGGTPPLRRSRRPLAALI